MLLHKLSAMQVYEISILFMTTLILVDIYGVTTGKTLPADPRIVLKPGHGLVAFGTILLLCFICRPLPGIDFHLNSWSI